MTHNSRTTGKATLEDLSISYEITGEGHPLVLVHAGIADRRMWDDQIPAFAQHYWVIRYDMRGYGETEMVAGSFSHCRDLYNLLKFLAVEKAYMVGVSMGGTTIVDFTLEHPEMVEALIIVASAPGGYEPGNDEIDEESQKLQQVFQTAMQQRDIAKAAEIEVNYWLGSLRRPVDQIDPAIQARLYEMNKIALTNQAADLGSEQALEPPAVNRLDEIHVPTLVIRGDLDDPFIIKGSDLLATKIAGAQQAILAGTTHFPNMEQPTEFNRLVLEFLADVSHGPL
jgi:pimeloyl-ACP methyl ester carboxylesterase